MPSPPRHAIFAVRISRAREPSPPSPWWTARRASRGPRSPPIRISRLGLQEPPHRDGQSRQGAPAFSRGAGRRRRLPETRFGCFLGDLSAAKPFSLSATPRKVMAHNATSVNYRDGVKFEGKLVSDDVLFEVHEVDLQLVLPTKQQSSLVWEVLKDDAGAKKQFFDAQHKKYQEIKAYYDKHGGVIPESQIRDVISTSNTSMWPPRARVTAKAMARTTSTPRSTRANRTHRRRGRGRGPSRTLPPDRGSARQDQVHGQPRTALRHYYAIYFTMTALHGLHVIGGALVLLFFAVFGKKLYLKNPSTSPTGSRWAVFSGTSSTWSGSSSSRSCISSDFPKRHSLSSWRTPPTISPNTRSLTRRWVSPLRLHRRDRHDRAAPLVRPRGPGTGRGRLRPRLLVASVKASLVALIFMHLNHEKGLIYKMLVFTFFFASG